MWADRGPYLTALVPASLDVSTSLPWAYTDTYPDTLHIECNTIGRDAFVVSGFENIVFPCLVCETATQPIDISFECVRSEKFMGECRERQVEVVF